MSDFAKHFETKTRDNGERFTSLKDDRPEWLQDAVYAAHQGTMPNDWIYAECLAAIESFDADELSDEDNVHEFADARVDVYTKALYQWATDMCLTDTWAKAEGEVEDCGGMLDESIEKRIAIVQFYAIRFIAETMQAACAEASKETEEESEEAEA